MCTYSANLSNCNQSMSTSVTPVLTSYKIMKSSGPLNVIPSTKLQALVKQSFSCAVSLMLKDKLCQPRPDDLATPLRFVAFVRRFDFQSFAWCPTNVASEMLKGFDLL